jgi:hypothetical protein
MTLTPAAVVTFHGPVWARVPISILYTPIGVFAGSREIDVEPSIMLTAEVAEVATTAMMRARKSPEAPAVPRTCAV